MLALREEISPDEKQVLHPKSAAVAHAQCLLKIHKEFHILPVLGVDFLSK